MKTLRVVLGIGLACVAGAAHALTVEVPANYATISAAIASGADDIVVADGEYSGPLVVNRALVLRTKPIGTTGTWMATPSILGSVTFANGAASGLARVEGFRIQGDVLLQTAFAAGELRVDLRDCRVSGRIHRGSFAGMNGMIGIRSCIVEQGVDIRPYTAQIAFVTVLDGGLSCSFEGDLAVVHNHVQGAGPTSPGIVVPIADFGGRASDNSVVGTQDGIVVNGTPGGFLVTRNAITDCARDGVVATAGTPRVEGNTITRPGRHGVRVSGLPTVDGNLVDHPGESGIVASGTSSVLDNIVLGATGDGIVTGDFAASVDGNQVRGSGGSGIVTAGVSSISNNITGRNALDGIRTTGGNVSTFHGNTSYLNGGSGFRLDLATSGTPFSNNIAHGNSQYGLVWLGATGPRSCNDWFGNGTAPTSGVTPGATDLFVNPLFCNLPADDVSLAGTSPLVGTACGQIGARGVGCGTATEASARGAIGALGVDPNPSRGGVQFSWPQTAAAGSLEIYDVQGGLRWSRRIAAGERRHDWDGRDTQGRPVPPGVYLARMRAPSGTSSERVVRIR